MAAMSFQTLHRFASSEAYAKGRQPKDGPNYLALAG